jgi:hypothetical protein
MRYEIEHPTVLGQETLVDKLFLPLPNADGGGTRAFELLEVYPDDYEIVETGAANRVVYWENVPDLCAQTDCWFGFAFHVTLERPTYAVPWGDDTPYDTESALYQTYTQPQRGIASDDPAIRELALEIVGEETSLPKQVLLIQSWVQRNIRRPTPGEPSADDALQCIADGVGHCAGQTKVFIALCRAMGIPSRTVAGLRPYEQSVGQLETFGPRTSWREGTLDMHIWAEVYLPALGWVHCEADMPGFGLDKERLLMQRGPFALPGGLCQYATWLHLPMGVQGDWCGQSVGWEVRIDAELVD